MAIKKPKKLKYPRKPKQKASLQVHENYLAKVKEIDKENKKRESDYKRDVKKLDSVKKQIASIKR